MNLICLILIWLICLVWLDLICLIGLIDLIDFDLFDWFNWFVWLDLICLICLIGFDCFDWFDYFEFTLSTFCYVFLKLHQKQHRFLLLSNPFEVSFEDFARKKNAENRMSKISPETNFTFQSELFHSSLSHFFYRASKLISILFFRLRNYMQVAKCDQSCLKALNWMKISAEDQVYHKPWVLIDWCNLCTLKLKIPRFLECAFYQHQTARMIIFELLFANILTWFRLK